MRKTKDLNQHENRVKTHYEKGEKETKHHSTN